ncbi:ATP-binding protein [Rhizobiaceae bacterium BDR2-2]|uniref:histidine kinase n=1 Tax=Ectorhizobium quercum TaxID=2965071 RepID=A0AAE3SVB5_9HYPH|nr:ATP-binding protein [Ectorhizobium quercum]MCX8996160.1 ATP-binding protein [Ectorhizobium quercum]MCX8998801.1 ATP-binding protein [Ectorhizobium quercum]
MVAAYYPFIDIAVHEKVRAHYAAGDALALFSTGMEQALWANGAGAALFDFSSVYDFIEQGPDRLSVFFRQLQASASRLAEPGESRSFLMRIATSFRSATVNATAEVITLDDGERALLLSVPGDTAQANTENRAQQMLAGLDDDDTHMAVLDAEGGLIAASAGFADLGVTPHTARTLVTLAAEDPAGLVKRPVPTVRGHLPSAAARIADGLHLILIVEPEAEAEPPPAVPVAEPDDAVAQSFDAAAPGTAGEDGAEAASSDGINEESTADTQTPVAAEDPAVPASAPIADDTPGAEPAFTFDPARRTFRFVWKTDAEGRFSDVSGEFADAVGPQAADITGRSFADLATRYGLDGDGKISEVLARRDTWSGKTVLWPVQGTRLKVPVDLAALPAYSRTREFDGFRGFGIVRPGDAVDDPDGIGLTIGTASGDGAAAADTLAEEAPIAEEPAFDQAPSVAESMADPEIIPEDEPAAAAPSDEVADIAREDEAAAEGEAAEEISPASVDETDDAAEETAPDEGENEWPSAEPPALRVSENAGRRLSDKIISLEQHRSRATDNLTPGEQAAFQEIGRKLESLQQHEDGETEDDQPAAEAGVPGPAETVDEPDTETAETPAPAAFAEQAPEEPFVPVQRDPQADGLTPAILAQMPVALLVLAGDVLYHANPEFLRLTGYENLDAVREVGGLDALLQRADLDGKELATGTMMVVCADDEVVPVTARLQSVRWENTSALLLALMPVERDQSETTDLPAPEATVPDTDASEIARLRVETDELRSILETATDGVVILGADGDIRSMNRSASALFNYDNDETRGKPFVMLFAHESQRAVADYLSGLSGNGVMSVLNDGREVIGREASGGFLPLFMTIGRLTSSNGYCAVIRDITQWKRSEEELRNAKRAAETANAHKTDFLARVSHEIRTPLNAIIGFADLLASEHFGPIGHPRYVEYANDIGRSGRHVLDIVNDLLDISKIEAGEMELDFTAVSLNETIAEAVSLVQPQANGQRVIIRTALSQAVPAVVADMRSIKQIVLNILANSIRFTPAGGQIVVSTSYEANGSVSLRIRDTGIGMTRAELEQAMKPFRQITSSQQKRGEGTGLGLPLTKAMTEANRASFVIQSAPNEGTLVEIAFPPQRVLAN